MLSLYLLGDFVDFIFLLLMFRDDFLFVSSHSNLFLFYKSNTFWIPSSSLRLSALPSLISADSGYESFWVFILFFLILKKTSRMSVWVLCVWCVSVCSRVWIWLRTCLCLCGGQRTSWGVGFPFSLHLMRGFILFAAVYTKLARSGASRHCCLHSPFHWRSAGTRLVYHPSFT